MEAYLLFLELLLMSLFPLLLKVRHLEHLILIPSTCKIRLDITSFVSHLWSRLSLSFKLSSWRSAAVVWNLESSKPEKEIPIQYTNLPLPMDKRPQ